MKWLLDRGRSVLTAVMLKALAQFFAAIFPTVYWVVIRDQSLAYFIAAPLAVKVFIILTAVVPIAIYLAYYLCSPMSNGVFTSRYWHWFKAPIRRVSFDVDNYLGLSGASDRLDATVHCFQGKLRINWRAVRPTEAFLTSNLTGRRVQLLIDTGSAVGPQHSVPASSIDRIPTGRWFNCTAQFGGLIDQKFLEEFGSFRLSFVYSGHKSANVNFWLIENRVSIDRFLKYTQPKPGPNITLKST